MRGGKEKARKAWKFGGLCAWRRGGLGKEGGWEVGCQREEGGLRSDFDKRKRFGPFKLLLKKQLIQYPINLNCMS